MLSRVNKLILILIFFGVLLSCNDGDKSLDQLPDCFSMDIKDFKNGVNLLVSSNDWEELKKLRDSALAKKKISKKEKKYFYAFLQTDSCSAKVRFRFKGDHTDHLWGDKWSFRVKSANSSFLGENKISIQSPHTRNFMLEWYFHQLMKKEDVISLDYFFFPFSVNDTTNKGVYAFEGHFSNDLLQSNHKKIGPILKFNEDNVWNAEFLKGVSNRDFQIMLNAEIEICNPIESDEFLLLSKEAKQKLKMLINNQISPAKVLDIEKWGTYIGCMDVFSSAHHLRWHNIRWYYNPDSKKFEPIAFDLSSQMKQYQFLYTKRYKDGLTKIILNDSLIDNAVVSYMKKLTSDKYLESFFYEIENSSSAEYDLLTNDYKNYDDPKNKILLYRDSLKIDLLNNLNAY